MPKFLSDSQSTADVMLHPRRCKDGVQCRIWKD